jgi:hypothetical protein
MRVWVAGVVALLVTVSVAATLVLSRSGQGSAPRPLKDLAVVASDYSELAGALASLSLAAVVFIATLAPDSPAFDTAIGLFILAFLVLVASAMEFAATPSLADESQADGLSEQYLSFLLANIAFYLGLALSWLGLRLLMLAIQLDELADLLTWVLLFTIILGSLRLVMHVYRYTGAAAVACLGMVGLSFIAGLGYRFVLSEAWEALWPSSDGPLRLSVVAFVLAGVGYIYQTLLFSTSGETQSSAVSRMLARYRSPWLFGFTQGVLTIVALAWISVAQT